jgi:hypothetical protein
MEAILNGKANSRRPQVTERKQRVETRLPSGARWPGVDGAVIMTPKVASASAPDAADHRTPFQKFDDLAHRIFSRRNRPKRSKKGIATDSENLLFAARK